MEPVLNQTRSAVFYFCVAVFALLAGCAIAPEPDMPEGLIDQKVELVGRINESPTDLDAHADLLRLQIRDGDAEGAQATCFHALKHNGADYRAHLLSAQFYRWQVDLISAEKSLLAARDLAPTRLEPRVALSALYHQTYMEETELEERRVAFTLAEPAWREEFRLDYAYACAQLGRDDQATELALPLAGNGDARKESRSRAFALLAEINLREERFDAVATSLQAACKLTPAEHGYVQLAARMATVLDQRDALAALFDEALSTQDAAEARWAALFGKWMLQVRADVGAGEDPLGEAASALYERMNVVAQDHPDTLTRRYQLLALDSGRTVEMEAERKKLLESEFGVPAVPRTLQSLLRLWRAEDAMRIGAPRIALAELDQLDTDEPGMDGLQSLRTIALFRARLDDRCVIEIESQQAALETPDPMLQSMRWWIMLRQGKAKSVLAELEGLESPTNATLWIEAVAQFHVYREQKAAPSDE